MDIYIETEDKSFGMAKGDMFTGMIEAQNRLGQIVWVHMSSEMAWGHLVGDEKARVAVSSSSASKEQLHDAECWIEGAWR